LTFSVVSINAIETGTSEIVITDIWLEPEHPKAGDKVAIVGNVYNGGTYRTDYYAKVVTVGVTIDGELRKIMELGNVIPGQSNSIKISTGPLWEAEWGKHNMTVVIDYHNTIPDQYDNPANNRISKIFNIEPVRASKITLDVFPAYIIPEKSSYITINGTLEDSDTETPLAKKNILLLIGNDKESLITDSNGKFSISKAITISSEKFLVTALFDGSFPNLPVNTTNYVFKLPPSKENAAVVLQINDPLDKYDFRNLPSQIAVFQDSYDTLYKKIKTTTAGVLLDNKTAWVGLPSNHSYLEEIYVDGRFFFSTDWKEIPVASVSQENITIPDPAQIRFHVTDTTGNPIGKTLVKNWIYSTETDDTGFTPWIDMLPTRTNKEPYVAVTLLNNSTFSSEPFFVTTGERKIIEIIVPQTQLVIPSWIKNNAKWWSEGSIEDSDFVKGIQYLLQQKIILVPTVSSGTEQATQQIPSWIKNNAKWWSEGSIEDSDFVKGIQYLIQIGIIRL
jgi:hypothetical protein